MKSFAVADEFETTSTSFGVSQNTQNSHETNQPHDIEESSVSIPSHPLGVKPSGNQYMATHNSRNAIGPFQILPDEFLVTLLEYLDAKTLIGLGYTCKALYGFCSLEDLWKALFLEYVTSSFCRYDVLYPQDCSYQSRSGGAGQSGPCDTSVSG